MGPSGFRFFLLFLLLLLLRSSFCQQPNSDESYVYDFLLQMGLDVNSSNPSSPVCPWKGVVCDSENDEYITSLVASGLGLRGFIPENTIGKMNKLQHLDLSRNGVTGLSSDFWGLGSSLRSLDLSHNRINGSIPNNFGNFGEMERLDLSHNLFSGEIPADISSLSSLKVLNLSSNTLSGSIADGLLGCKSLITVDMSLNALNGSVPEGFGSAFGNLSYLNLAGNRIHDNLPNFSGLESITYLNLSRNLLHGSLLGGLLPRTLEVVDFSNNQLDDHISQVTPNSSLSWGSLVYLDLSANHLSGDIFNELIDAWSLKHLNLASNRFSLQRFPKLNNLTSLEFLNVSGSNLAATIPAEISKLVNLTMLDLSRNHLTGNIPELIPRSLRTLDLSWNNLTGEIPLSLQQRLPHIAKFNFSYNNLTICSTRFSFKMPESAFIGSKNDCPIAVNPGPAVSGTSSAKHEGLKLALITAFSVFSLLVGLVCLAIGCRRRSRRWVIKQLSYREDQNMNISGPFSFNTDSTTWVADVKAANSVPVVVFEKPLLNFTFADLLAATSNFDRGTLLAEGRFGPVYRGFLFGGIHVAVKVLVHGSTLTDQEAARELEHLGRIKHPNLVPLLGYCIAGDRRIAIYDYMENGNLQNLLHDLPLDIQTVEDRRADGWEDDSNGDQSITSEGQDTWRFRHKIALGAARALAFLHHGCSPQIIHKDVKASSVFLDSTFEPRLSDFGLETILGSEFVGEMGQGSPGYTAPELSSYVEASSATVKSDVYGFGVVLFELLTGKKPIGDDYLDSKETSLVNWVRGLVRKNQVSKAIDPKIRRTGSRKQMEECLRIGYLCTADIPLKRPSMQQIVGLLKDVEPVILDE